MKNIKRHKKLKTFPLNLFFTVFLAVSYSTCIFDNYHLQAEKQIIYISDIHTSNPLLYHIDSLLFYGQDSAANIKLKILLSKTNDPFLRTKLLGRSLFHEKIQKQKDTMYEEIISNKKSLHFTTILDITNFELNHKKDLTQLKELISLSVTNDIPSYYKALTGYYLAKYYDERKNNLDSAWTYIMLSRDFFEKTGKISPAYQDCLELISAFCTYKRKNLLAVRYANVMFDFERYLPKADRKDSVRAYANRSFMVFREGDFEGCLEDIKKGLFLVNEEKEPELYQQLLKSKLVVHMLRQEDSLWQQTAGMINQNIVKSGIDHIDMNRWYGQYYAHQEQYKMAIPFLQKALIRETEKGNQHSARYSTLCFLLSLSFENLGDYNSALDYMAKNEGLETYDLQTMTNHLLQDKQYSFVTGLRCANIYFSKYKNKGDFNSLQLAKTYIDLIDRVMFSQFKVIEENAILQFYLESGQEFFHLGMDIHFELWKISGEESHIESFINYSDKNKNSLLYRDIQMAQRQTSLPDEMVEKEFNIRAAIKEEKRKGLRDNHRFNTLMDEYTLLETGMEKKYQKFTKKGLIQNNVTLNHVKKMITNNSNSIFVVDDTRDHLYYTVIKKDSVIVEKVKKDVQKNILIDDMLAILKTGKKINYQKTFAPFLLPHKIVCHLTDQIYYIADGIYHRFPLEAIVDNPECKVVHMPSIRLYEKFSVDTNIDQGVVLFAFSDQNTIRSKKRTRLVELPGTYIEVKKLSHQYKDVTTYTGKQATKTNFLKAYQNPAIQYIHLALHGVANSFEKDDVKLFFRSSEGGLDSLYGYELLCYKSTCKKIVLSACQSGLGTYEKGEGLFSLPRYFMLNGATDVKFHYWDVED